MSAWFLDSELSTCQLRENKIVNFCHTADAFNISALNERKDVVSVTALLESIDQISLISYLLSLLEFIYILKTCLRYSSVLTCMYTVSWFNKGLVTKVVKYTGGF